VTVASFANSSEQLRCSVPIAVRNARTIFRLLPLLLLAACGQYGAPGAGWSPVEIGADGWKFTGPTHYYPPPGPPEDPWGPYIREAAGRYHVPEQWVRAVMQQESGGEEQATSPVGAMGLMQVMPMTYDGLRARHGLGNDPYDPHNNILAGTAYIREMYDRYGAPGFLAAYNAGPDRVDSYLAGASDLPDETVNYVAAITPNLGRDAPMSGPLARYASARSGRATRHAPTVVSLASGCDLNAAYDPNHPCSTLMQAAAQPAPSQPVYVAQAGADGCDVNAAYNPDHPCTAVPQPAGARLQLASADGCDPDAAYNPDRLCDTAPVARSVRSRPARVQAVAASTPAPSYHHTTPPQHEPPGRFAALASSSAHPTSSGGQWAIQVGAFANPGLARAVAESARAQAPKQLQSAVLSLPPTPSRGSALYRARLGHLSEIKATSACAHLNHHQLPCIIIRPNES
jgi:D-alanyl-D-alanine carboxypeptidase